MNVSEVSKICLFVRNLPYSATDSDLEAAFKAHGPLKSCYTVKHKGQSANQCRGFGYVTFDSREDAQKALSRIKFIKGRPVQLTFAKKKKFKPVSGGGRKGKGEGGTGGGVDSPTEEEEEEEEEEDYEALTARDGPVVRRRKAKSERSEARFDVGRVVVLKDLPEGAKEWRLRKKCQEYGEIEEVVHLVNSDPSTTHVTFATHRSARLAVKGLDGSKYKKSSEGVMGACLLSLESKALSSKTLKKSCVIVRNLSFQLSEGDVTEMFGEFGKVLSVRIPRKENGYMRGFAFVQFGSYFDAASAIAGLNGTEVRGRTVTVDWALPKNQYQQNSGRNQTVSEEATAQEESGGESEEGEGENEESQESEESDEGGGSEGSGEEEEEGEGSADEWEEEEGLEDEWVESEEESEEEEGSGGSDEWAGLKDGSDAEGSEDNEEDSDSSEDELVRYKLAPHKNEDVEEGKTLFIRNLPFTSDRTEVLRLVQKFGAVRYCRLMLHPDTGVPTGSAFVQFRTPSAAQKCLRVASDSEEGMVYEGQRLNVTLAVPRGEVEKMHKEGTEKQDKRNLCLAKEGVIFPNSDAARDLSKSDMAKRTKAYAEKKAKLADPHYYVSKTRLCIRNLPTSVDEKKLKAIFQNAADTPDTTITQVKILRSTERVDSRGVGRSMGYGFMEFSNHDSALLALRATNNNPTIFGKMKRPIVDFAVEDSRVMKIREKRLLKQQSVQGSAEGGGNSRLAKRKKWQLKWQAKRQKRKKMQDEKLETSDSKSNEGQSAARRTSSHKRRPQTTASSEEEEEEEELRPRRKRLGEKSLGELSHVAKRSKHRPRNVPGRRSHGNKEETRFTEMISKYRLKMERLL